MTSLETQVYNFIISYKTQHNGNSPSVREIGAAIGDNSTSHVRYLLDKLVYAGLIEYEIGQARSIVAIGGRWIPPNDL